MAWDELGRKKVTVGELKKYIEEHNIPDDAEVVYQRIEDRFFEQHHWTTIPLIFEMTKDGPWMSEYIRCFQPHLKEDGEKTYLALEAHY